MSNVQVSLRFEKVGQLRHLKYLIFHIYPPQLHVWIYGENPLEYQNQIGQLQKLREAASIYCDFGFTHVPNYYSWF